MKIAIIGATSTIAKEYIKNVLLKSVYNLDLFSRNPTDVRNYINSFDHTESRLFIKTYEQFVPSIYYDAIINFIGKGDPQKLKNNSDNNLIINDLYDNKILSYISLNKSTKYIYLSSGACYLSEFEVPANEKDFLNINFQQLENHDVYSVSKCLSEVKHRKLQHLNIIDLRIFGYVQTLNILSEGSLLGSVFSASHSGLDFLTTSSHLMRDYINSKLFYEAVECLLSVPNINCALDLYSKEAISKSEILDIFSQNFGLKIRIDDDLDLKRFSTTGMKKNYFSNGRSMRKFGYDPLVSSKDIIIMEAEKVLSKQY